MNCPVCNSDQAFFVELGNFYLSQSFEKLCLDNKRQNIDFPSFKYTINYCNKCKHTHNSASHPSLISSSELEGMHVYDLRCKSNEPEHHFNILCDLINKAAKSLGLESLRVLGLTYKDSTLIDKIRNDRLSNKKNIIFNEDDTLRITLSLIRSGYNISDLCDGNCNTFIVRHFLEHVPNPRALLSSLVNALDERGLIVIEVPSSENIVNGVAIGQIWEEHYHYFSKSSLTKLIQSFGYSYETMTIDNDYEPIIVGIIKKGMPLGIAPNCTTINPGNRAINIFINPNTLIDIKDYLALQLSKYKNRRLVYFGAGHIGIKSLAFYGLSNCFRFIVDDNPLKVNATSKSVSLPVLSTSELEPGDLIVHSFSEKQISSNKRLREILIQYDNISLNFLTSEFNGTN